MQPPFMRKEFSASNPIANAFVVIAGVLVIGVSIVLGFFAFLALSAIILVVAAVVGIRVWWFNRQLQRTSGVNDGRADSGTNDGVIEGEYRVVHKKGDEA